MLNSLLSELRVLLRALRGAISSQHVLPKLRKFPAIVVQKQGLDAALFVI
jgi:hypothetical protein